MNIYLENAPAATEQEGPMAPAPTTLDEWLGAIYDEESMAPAGGMVGGRGSAHGGA